MKSKHLKFFTIIIVLAFINSCKAQLMQTVNDAGKIQANKDFYVGKQFKVLLQDIKPQVLCYVAHFDSNSKKDGVRLGFLPQMEYLNKMWIKGATPTTIGVVFQDISFFNNIIKNNKTGNWTTGLSDSLSNLVIKRVYGYGNGIEAIPPHWIVVSCVYKKVMVDGLNQWRYEITKRYCNNGNLGTETQVTLSTTKVDVESCGVPLSAE